MFERWQAFKNDMINRFCIYYFVNARLGHVHPDLRISPEQYTVSVCICMVPFLKTRSTEFEVLAPRFSDLHYSVVCISILCISTFVEIGEELSSCDFYRSLI